MKTEKRIDENLYNEKSLYLLNIKELRDLGRKIGVPAPATLKKQDLVDYILKIVYGEVDAPKRSSYGRPNVRDVDMNQYLTKIMKKTDVYDEVLSASFGDIDSIFKVAAPDESSKINNVEHKTFVEDGGKYYLRKFAFIESDNDNEVSKQQKEKFGLENFDIVEVIVSGKTFKIVSINGKVVNSVTSNNNENLGKKQVFHFSTKEEIKNEILNQIEYNLDYKVIVYSSEEYNKEGIEYIKTDKSLDSEMAYKQFMSFVTLCEKYVFEGENIVVITDESAFIQKVIESLDEDVSLRIKKHLQARIEELLSLGNALLVYKQDIFSATYQ